MLSVTGAFFTSEFFSIFGLFVSEPELLGAEVLFWTGSDCVLCTNSADSTSAPGTKKREGMQGLIPDPSALSTREEREETWLLIKPHYPSWIPQRSLEEVSPNYIALTSFPSVRKL